MDKPAWMVAAIAAAAEARPQARTIVPDTVDQRTVHIDGDYMAYRCAGSDECPAGIARSNVRDKAEALKEMSGSKRAVIHLSMSGGTKGERFLIAQLKPYQGNRSYGKRPKNWEMLRAYLETHDPKTNSAFAVARWYDREADDGFAGASSRAADPEQTVAIASPDKDMRMLPGLHIDYHDYTLTSVPRGTYELIGPYNGLVYGHKWFWLQTLQGDTADNIPGLPRAEGKLCGDKTAAKYLAGTTCNEEAFEVVSKLYRGTYGDDWADQFVEQASLLWLRTDTKASVDDYRQIVPLTNEIELATQRLVTRVKEHRATIDALTAKAREAEAN